MVRIVVALFLLTAVGTAACGVAYVMTGDQTVVPMMASVFVSGVLGRVASVVFSREAH
jgi:hypothetical protein